jgi:nickel transport system ATP-binding protein
MLLKVDNIHKSFPLHGGLFGKRRQPVLRGVSFEIGAGECLGIVGESGSGKSTLGRIILGLESADAGRIVLDERLRRLPRHEAVSVVFQDYSSSVNPRFTVRQIIGEPLLRGALRADEAELKIRQLLDEVGLDATMLERHPHQLSGGQLQRVCIARAIAPDPRFILFDEAVSSLDVSVQVRVLDLLLAIQRKRRLTFLFITHDISVAAYLCDRLIFFKEGRVVEELRDLARLGQVEHAYTRELLDAASYLEVPYEARDRD